MTITVIGGVTLKTVLFTLLHNMFTYCQLRVITKKKKEQVKLYSFNYDPKKGAVECLLCVATWFPCALVYMHFN
jgi:hypothetical protein